MVHADKYTPKVFEIAYNYVNVVPGNKAKAFRLYYDAHNIQHPESTGTPYYFFEQERVKECIAELQEENRERFKHLREDNIARLLTICEEGTLTQQLNATRELNNMMGFNTTNVNVDNKIEIVIE